MPHLDLSLDVRATAFQWRVWQELRKIPYGETVLPRGLRLAVVSRSGQTVTVQYLGKPQTIPIDSADLR